jgi:NADH-quinone oxidoreductase subunit L
MTDNANETLRWIPLLPLIAAAISGIWLMFVSRNLPRSAIILLACGAPLASFGIALFEVFQLTQLPVAEGRFFVDNVYTWIGAHPFHAELAFLLDPLSAVMVLVVTGVGSLIHIYSVGYMDDDHRDDRGFQRFFAYLNLFLFAMLMLVLGDNLLVMFVGWEGVGLCSYLLIGFWYLEDHNAMCGQKAFVVNRIGDFGFLLGIFLLFWAFFQAGQPTVEFRAMAASIESIASQTVALPSALSFLPAFPTWGLLTLAGLCLFVGAMGKSAQIPLYVWLPDAMAGPTPVSALIHAATMVTAGVYMVCRMSFLYTEAPGALATVAWAGALTAFFAATIGICQKDIKKVLLDGQPARLHVHGRGSRRLLGGDLPPDDPRLLQGAALPRGGLRNPGHAPRAGHRQDGRTLAPHAGDPRDLPDRGARDLGSTDLLGLLLQGRDPARSLPRARCARALLDLGDRGADGRRHRLLHVPALLPDLPG